MDFIHKHRKFWVILVAVATLALIATSFLPYLVLFR